MIFFIRWFERKKIYRNLLLKNVRQGIMYIIGRPAVFCGCRYVCPIIIIWNSEGGVYV